MLLVEVDVYPCSPLVDYNANGGMRAAGRDEICAKKSSKMQFLQTHKHASLILK